MNSTNETREKRAVMKKTHEVLMPEYLKNFTCIGPDCSDSCCTTGWTIDIDKKTYKKYSEVQDKTLSKIFKKYLTKNNENNSDNLYAKIQPKTCGTCPLLSDEKLCTVQENLGEESLSYTCNHYPRYYSNINSVFEISATLSCPEIARLALLNKGYFEFEQGLFDLHEDARAYSITVDSAVHSESESIFNMVRSFSIGIIQRREFRLWERMTILGLYIETIEDSFKKKKIKQIEQTTNMYINALNNPQFIDDLSNIQRNGNEHASFMKQIHPLLEAFAQRSEKFSYYVKKTKKVFKQHQDHSLIEHHAHYQKIFHDFDQNFLVSHEYIYEHHLVNYIFQHRFPVKNINFFEQFRELSVLYSVLKYISTGVFSRTSSFSPETAVEIIQSFTKVVEHSNLLDVVIQKVMKGKFSTMVALTSLLHP